MGGAPDNLKGKFDRGDGPDKGMSKKELRQDARKKKKRIKKIVKTVNKIGRKGPATAKTMMKDGGKKKMMRGGGVKKGAIAAVKKMYQSGGFIEPGVFDLDRD